MGYEIHITRRANWFDEGPGIALEEWEEAAARDPVLSPEGTISWRVEGKLVEAKIFVVREPGNPDNAATALSWGPSGNVTAKHPDRAGIAHMAAIAARLNARVQGDEGELYDARGNEMRDAGS